MEIITKLKSECETVKDRLKSYEKTRLLVHYLRGGWSFKHSNIRIHNFWKVNKPKDLWFYGFINHRLKGYYNHTNPVNFFSVYGKRETLDNFSRSPRIFYSGENIDLYPEYQDNALCHVDLSLGLEYLEAVNYLRFPLWIMYFINPKSNFKEVSDCLHKLSHHKHDFNKTRKFCTQISSHDNNGIRTKMCDIVGQLGPIEYAGAFRNNTTDLKTRYHDSKQYFLTLYKFNICPENSNKDGYVTEKLFEAISAGTIPVYWGSNNNPEPNILNPDAILFYNENDESLRREVSALNSNPKLYRDFLNIKRFKPHAAEYVWDTIKELESKLKQIERNS